MKTTVKLDSSRSLVIEPQGRAVRLAIRVGAVVVGSMTLSGDQLGAAMFGLEQAAEAAAEAHAIERAAGIP